MSRLQIDGSTAAFSWFFANLSSRALLARSGAINLRVAYVRESQIPKLLTNTRGLSGDYQPGIINRYYVAYEWALQAKGLVKVALVPRPELIHLEKFGVAAAVNAGLHFNVFTSDARGTGMSFG